MGKIRPKPLTLGQIFGRRVQQERERQRLTQKEVVERLAALGRPMDRSNLGRIERGETTGQLDNLIALALALHVAPIHLLLPQEDEERVELASKQSLPAGEARSWIAGRRLLPDSDPWAYFAAMSRAEQEQLADEAASTVARARGISPLVFAASRTDAERQRDTQWLRDSLEDLLAEQARTRKEDDHG